MLDTYNIRGVLTLTSVAHQSSPDKSGNHTPLLSTRVLTDMRPQVIPIITANSVRAVMRRLAADRVVDQLLAKKQQISRDSFLSMCRGAYSRTGMKAGDATLQEIVAARSDVFAGLWGGGARMFPARLRMERDLMPMVEETRDLFPLRLQAMCRGSAVLRDDEGNYRGSGLTAQMLLTGRDDVAAGRGADVIADYEKAYVEHVINVEAKAARKKAQAAAVKAAKTSGEKLVVDAADKAKADSLATFATLDVIVPGTRLYFGMSLRGVTQGQLGLALLALQDWANVNALGGGAVRGRGSFLAALSLEHNGAVLLDNLLTGEPPAYALARHADVDAAVARAQTELAAITPDSLGLVYPTTTEADVAEAA